jgi:polyisoprenyl-phosphate glycosyltransferase
VSSSETRDVSIVVACLDERNNLALLRDRIAETLRPVDVDWTLIYVDDGSSDGSVEVLRRLVAEDPRVRFVSLSRNFGHQAALSAGLDRADGDAVVLMDADLQHPPELLPEMIRLWRSGYDVVNTVRVDDRRFSFKGWTARGFYALFRRLSDVELKPGAADFRLLDRKVVDELRVLPERNRFYRGLVSWIGFRQIYLPYQPALRRDGSSKYTLRRMSRLALDGLLSFSEVPLVLVFIVGFAFIAISLIYALWVVVAHIATDRTITGWSSLMVAILVLGSAILLSVGIASLYLAKIYQEVKGRPQYIVRETDRKIPEGVSSRAEQAAEVGGAGSHSSSG